MLGELPLDDQTKKPVVPELETVRGLVRAVCWREPSAERSRERSSSMGWSENMKRGWAREIIRWRRSEDEPWRLCCPRRCFSILAEPTLAAKPWRPRRTLELATRLSYFPPGSQPDTGTAATGRERRAGLASPRCWKSTDHTAAR